MPNVLASSGMIGTNRSPITGSFMRSFRIRTNAIVVATCCLPEPRRYSSKTEAGGCGSGLARHPPAERGPPLLHVLDLVGVRARVVVRREVGLQRRVGDRQVEPVAELL